MRQSPRKKSKKSAREEHTERRSTQSISRPCLGSLTLCLLLENITSAHLHTRVHWRCRKESFCEMKNEKLIQMRTPLKLCAESQKEIILQLKDLIFSR